MITPQHQPEWRVTHRAASFKRETLYINGRQTAFFVDIPYQGQTRSYLRELMHHKHKLERKAWRR